MRQQLPRVQGYVTTREKEQIGEICDRLSISESQLIGDLARMLLSLDQEVLMALLVKAEGERRSLIDQLGVLMDAAIVQLSSNGV